MRVVNGIEREMIQSEWENWLADENLRCEQVSNMLLTGAGTGGTNSQHLDVIYDGDAAKREGQKILSSDTTSMGTNGDGEGEKMTRREALKKWYAEYCGACEADQRALWEGKKMRQVEMSPFIG